MIETILGIPNLFLTLTIGFLVLGILIFVHELGHFLVAKWCRVGVLEFAIGFGKKVLSWKWGSTTYSFRLIPLGGFVRMVGDDPRIHPDEILENEELTAEERELVQDQSLWFIKKGYWAKSAIVFAGPFFNLAFAFIIGVFSAVLIGRVEAIDEALIGQTLPGRPAERAGLRENDRILSVNGTPVVTWHEMATLIAASGGEPIDLLIQRAGAENTIVKLATEAASGDIAVLEGRKPEKRQQIGISPQVRRVPVAPLEGVVLASTHIYRITSMTLRGLFGMATGQVSSKNIGGPILIFQQAVKQAERGFEHLIDFMILLSVSLAILNLLPVPILDGGHLVFFTIEALIGGPLNARVIERAQQVGMALLLLLMVFAMSNDLQRLAGW